MKKTILILLSFMLLAVPVSTVAQTEAESIETPLSTISMQVSNNTVHINGANGKTMEIFNLTGVKVFSVKIDSADKSYALNLPKGCYILKVGKFVRKISIR
jgi:hypothetical protein